MSFVNPLLLLQNHVVFVDKDKLATPRIDLSIDTDTQLQPSGIDLRIDRFTRLITPGSLSPEDKKLAEEEPVGELNGWFHLIPHNAYMAYFVESCALPPHMSALIWGRSTLVRNGILCISMVYDPGYQNVIACPVFPFIQFSVKRYSRLAQFCGQTNNGSLMYKGGYSRKEIREQDEGPFPDIIGDLKE
jgi:deoxycytidine triphosphate deaminase